MDEPHTETPQVAGYAHGRPSRKTHPVKISRRGTTYGTTTPGSSSRFQASPANGQLIAPVTPRRRIGDLNRQTDHRGQTSHGTADGVTPADRHADIVGSKSGDFIVSHRDGQQGVRRAIGIGKT